MWHHIRISMAPVLVLLMMMAPGAQATCYSATSHGYWAQYPPMHDSCPTQEPLLKPEVYADTDFVSVGITVYDDMFAEPFVLFCAYQGGALSGGWSGSARFEVELDIGGDAYYAWVYPLHPTEGGYTPGTGGSIYFDWEC